MYLILDTLATNLRHAARSGQDALIGGGEFTPPELADAAEAIRLAQLVADNARALLEALDRDLPHSAKHHAAGERFNLRGVLTAYQEAAR